MRIGRFGDIEAWQLARKLTRKVYRLKKLDQQYITKDEFQDVYNHAGRNRAAIRGFIKYLLDYKKGQRKRKKINPELLNGYKKITLNAEPLNGYGR